MRLVDEHVRPYRLVDDRDNALGQLPSIAAMSARGKTVRTPSRPARKWAR
jgi:hypothetical protein